MKKEELAKWLHDNYEDIAKNKNWNTQENCKVEFDALPDSNKRVMLEIANRLLDFDLLRLPVVSESKMPRTIFIDGDTCEEIHSANTLIRFTIDDGVDIKGKLYIVESVDVYLDNNLIKVWLDTPE